MDQARILKAGGPVGLSLMLSLSGTLGCKDRNDGPRAPEASSTLIESSPSPVTAEDAIPADPEPKDITASPPSANSGLPEAFLTGLTDCQKQNRYYDLQLSDCTEIPLAEFPCDMTVLLADGSAILSPAQKRLLGEYSGSNLQGFSLYACTVEESKPVLHFYKVEVDKIRAHNVTIASP